MITLVNEFSDPQKFIDILETLGRVLGNVDSHQAPRLFPPSGTGCRDERKTRGRSRANSCKPDEKEVLEADTPWKLDRDRG